MDVFIQIDLHLLFRAELILKLSCVARTWAEGGINLTLFLSQVGLERVVFNTSQVKRRRCENVQTIQTLLLLPQVILALC